jgi:hypothetical protein
MTTELTKDFVLEMLEYIPSTGMLLQKKARPKVQVGSIAGVVTPKGYRYIQFNGKKYAAHRLVWLIENGKFPSLFIDHIDGNKLNNVITNLREVTGKQNNENKGAQRNSQTGIRGVSFNKKLKKFVAQIQHNGENHYLGLHETPQEAEKAYIEAAKKFFTHHISKQ